MRTFFVNCNRQGKKKNQNGNPTSCAHLDPQ